jgi:serine/threonine protein kinase/Tol biopolymer transport system component
MIGTTLSHYKIVDELGRGGMGIVYKALDTKLDRTVAIKVLPSAALASADDRARFYREAKAAAKLHHPHIASVFEIDEAVPSDAPHGTEPSPFIAMEYIDGEPLSDLIQRAPLKLDEAVRMATQIARALEVAHEEGIVHRDIKAQNVMITRKGEAKVLDFGLAQTTASTKLTRMGSTLGTVAYMSPEQARGEDVDHRTDIWALGVTLFEMISGKNPFSGDYEQAVVYSILNEDHEPLSGLRTGVPLPLESIVDRMLRKKAEHRYQSAADLIADLAAVDLSAASTRSSVRLAAPSTVDKTTGNTGSRIAWGLVVVLLLAVLALLLRPRAVDVTPSTTSLTFEQGAGMEFAKLFALSPDETKLAYVSWPSVDGGKCWIRDLRTGEGWSLENTEGCFRPFWSPDSRRIAYFADNTLRTVSVEGGVSTSLATLESPQGGSWGSQGTIVFADNRRLYSVSETGGVPKLEHDIDEWIRDVNFHPNGTDYLFSYAQTSYKASLSDSTIVHAGDGRSPTFVGPNRVVVSQVIPGTIGGTAVLFDYDMAAGQLVGDGMPLFDSVSGPLAVIAWSIGSTSLVYHNAETDASSMGLGFSWLGLDGSTMPIGWDERSTFSWNLSPSGRLLAEAQEALSIRNVQSGIYQTYNLGFLPFDFSWSHDDLAVIYTSLDDRSMITSFNFEAERIDTLYDFRDGYSIELEWDSRNDLILSVRGEDFNMADLYVIDLEEGSDTRILTEEGGIYEIQLSPDGRWLAYEAGPTERDRNLFVRSWPDLRNRTSITDAGGANARWDGSGSRLFYLNAQGQLEYADLSGTPGNLTVSTKQIPLEYLSTDPWERMVTQFAVHPDGNRILVRPFQLMGRFKQSSLTYVQGWQDVFVESR